MRVQQTTKYFMGVEAMGDNHIMFTISTNLTESYAIAFDKYK